MDILASFNPALLHVVRKKGHFRVAEKETVLNLQDIRLTLQVDGKRMTILNSTSNLDQGRNIPGHDFMFNMKEERLIEMRTRNDNVSVETLAASIYHGCGNPLIVRF